MSNLSDYIYSTLNGNAGVTALVSDRIYPQALPQTEIFPCIVFSQVSNVPTNTKSSATLGKSSLDLIRVQITIMAQNTDGYSGESKTQEIGEAVRAALDYTSGVGIQLVTFQGAVEAYDSNSGQDGVFLLYQDYNFWKQL